MNSKNERAKKKLVEALNSGSLRNTRLFLDSAIAIGTAWWVIKGPVFERLQAEQWEREKADRARDAGTQELRPAQHGPGVSEG